jgi:MraZ protein
MSSFTGRFSYTVDSKGRIALPARLRKSLMPSASETFYITRGFEQCLYGYPSDEWSRIVETFRTLQFTDPQHRFFARTFFEWANDSQLDAQSRIIVPQRLLDYAKIEKEKELLIIGVLERIELWSPAVYEEYQKNQAHTYETVAERVFKRQL